jgi:oxygen-dependent protoporphyrinogen oxidase
MPSFIWNLLRGSSEVPSFQDVSIGDEFLRRGGRREPVDNMLSAMCHGIYGGDVWKLSAESSIFAAAFMNQRLRYSYPSPLEKWRNPMVPMLVQDHDLLKQTGWIPQVARWVARSKEIKSFNFGQGFGVLNDAVVAKLKANPNVKFVNERVAKVRLSASNAMEVRARP